MNLPGVYLLAHFNAPILGNANPQSKEIIYIGETCEQKLAERWHQFHRCAFEGKRGYSGGISYWKAFGTKEKKHLFVASIPVLSKASLANWL